MSNEQSMLPLPTEWFWNILETSNHKLQNLVEKLEQLSKEEMIAYQFQYEDAEEFINPYYSREMEEYIGDCSEDHAEDFADWVVSQGRIFFNQVRSNPASAQNYLTMYDKCDYDEDYPHLKWECHVEREEYRGWQSPGSIARAIYERHFGESLYELVIAR